MGWLDSWLGTKSAPGPDAVPLTAAVEGWARGGFARSYDGQVREVFEQNPVGQRAVRLVASSLGGLTVEASGEGAEAASLVTAELLETMAAQLLLHGNAYVHGLDDAAGALEALMPLRPERVSIATDAKGWASAYLYRVGGKAPRRIEALDKLGRLRIVHPYGVAGRLPWQGDPENGAAWGDETPDNIVALSKRIFTASQRAKSRQFQSYLRAEMSRGKRLAFLGFGFDPMNVAMLFDELEHDNPDMLISLVGIGEVEQKAILRLIYRLTGITDESLITLENMKAFELLRDYGRFLES